MSITILPNWYQAYTKTLEYNFVNERNYKLTICLSVAIFLMLFMLIFQPFGVNNYATGRIFTLEFVIILSSIMLLSLAVLLINEFLLRKWIFFKATLLHVFAWSIWSIFFLSQAIFLLYNILGRWHDFSIASALEFFIDVGSVVMFPMIGTFFYFRYLNLKQAYQQVLSNKNSEINPDSLIHFEGKGVNESQMISVKDFIYARAQDNYVELVYRNHENISRALIRTSLSSLSENISTPFIHRCHRSFLINLYNVRALSEGSELKLYVNYMNESIPVSKTYRDKTREFINNVKNFE